MPANIAHLLICNKAVKALQNGGKYEEFINILHSDDCKPYLNLGSIGPDLSYYGSQWEGLKSLILDQVDKPLGVDGWSYLLHSREPNRFPLTLIELTWKDTRWEQKEWEQIDHYKFAFTCGFLSHMAADQIIHPMVNDIAGPYYRSGENRRIHRGCGIYQDVALFHRLDPQEDFMEKSFHLWVDIAPKTSRNVPDWFRYFIQRAFVESHGVYPKEEEIEDWIDGLLLILRGLKHVGPYKKRYQELKTQGFNSEKSQRYFRGYMDFFFNAVDLTSIYWRALFELYDPAQGTIEISERMRARFRSIVQNADLSSPLQRDILADAREALLFSAPNKSYDLIRKTSAPLDRGRILSVAAQDVEKFSEA